VIRPCFVSTNNQPGLCIFQDLTKFINHANEIKAANKASKDGGDLSIVKGDADTTNSKQ
jgi:hypothetical protein